LITNILNEFHSVAAFISTLALRARVEMKAAVSVKADERKR